MGRVGLSCFALRCLALAGILYDCINAYLFGAYPWLKLERDGAERMKAEAERQQDRLARLHDHTEDVQRLVTHLKMLKVDLRASLPSRRGDRAEMNRPLSSSNIAWDRFTRS